MWISFGPTRLFPQPCRFYCECAQDGMLRQSGSDCRGTQSCLALAPNFRNVALLAQEVSKHIFKNINSLLLSLCATVSCSYSTQTESKSHRMGHQQRRDWRTMYQSRVPGWDHEASLTVTMTAPEVKVSKSQLECSGFRTPAGHEPPFRLSEQAAPCSYLTAGISASHLNAGPPDLPS